MIRKMTDFNQMIWKNYLKEGMCVLDATVGNGYDALMIKETIGDNGVFYGFDIQKQAIESTAQRLENFKNVKLYCRSHAEILEIISENTLDGAIYNLGFLPGGDKEITTHYESTFESLNAVLKCLKTGALLSVSIYPGHEAGKMESEKLSKWLDQLDAYTYHVLKTNYTNQSDTAPYTYWIERKK